MYCCPAQGSTRDIDMMRSSLIVAVCTHPIDNVEYDDDAPEHSGTTAATCDNSAAALTVCLCQNRPNRW